MSYVKEHSVRLTDGNHFSGFTRLTDKHGPGIHLILGHFLDNEPVPYELRFSAVSFTPSAAENWLHEHKHFGRLVPADNEVTLSYVLRCNGLSEETDIVLADNGDGIPSKLFKKEIIRTGRYFKDLDDIEFEVSVATLEHWVSTFYVMQANGIKVPVPAGHEFFGDPDKNRGYVREMFIENESLFATIELIGEDGVKLSKTSDVSLYAPVEWVDGSGNVYYRPILHIALTTYPVVPGLKEFEAIAASLLSNKEKIGMDWTKIAKALEISGNVSDENAEELVLSAVEALGKKVTDVSDVKKTNADLTKEVGELKLSITPNKPDPVLVGLAKDNIGLKLGALVSGGRITPACREKLEKAIIGDGTSERLELSLSRGGSVIVDDIVLALAENDPAILGELSSQQTLALGDIRKGDGKDSSLVANAKARAEAAKV